MRKCIKVKDGEMANKIGTTSLQGTELLPPKCPLFGGSTVIGEQSKPTLLSELHFSICTNKC